MATRKWWDEARQRFEVLSSEAVRREVAHGDPMAAAERLKKLNEMPLLQLTDTAMDLAERLLAEHALPIKANVDAIHVALAASNSIEYLLTWNCKHLANATMRSKIEQTCRASDYEPPIICTPYELMEVLDV
ncbi:MAG TPA: type II toxin-antitoxin system VapC family toxin [Tepidisphaeraceae bacterium]|nr:type II toxin-antitoxin system VapC family toxin [Tepidisphaeraceae bacterium]